MKKMLLSLFSILAMITVMGCNSSTISDSPTLSPTLKSNITLNAQPSPINQQEQLGDVLISYGSIPAIGRGAKNRVTFKTPYANTNYAIIVSGEHSSESWYREKYPDGFEIGTNESSRTLYYFVIGTKLGAANPNLETLLVDNLKIEWGTYRLSGRESTVDLYFETPIFKTRPALFVSGVNESHVSYWMPTASKFKLINMSTASTPRELSWVAFGSRSDKSTVSVPYFTDPSSGLNVFYQLIGNSQLNFVEAYLEKNQTKTIRMNRLYASEIAAFGCREHGWLGNPWNVSTKQYDIRNEDSAAYVSTFFIGKVGN